MIQKVYSYIKENSLIVEHDKIVVGVSGGADSVCLLLVLLEMKKHISFDVCVVHINHGLRGEESDKDEEFVQKLCQKHHLPFKGFYYDVEKLAKENGSSVEEMGRIARYESFQKVVDDEGYNKIAVAHNANDNVETILYNLFRGSGITGLIGMTGISRNIIRPLLICTRKEIEQFLEQRGQCSRIDKSNFSEDYTRNKIRLNLIPYVEENINAKGSAHVLDMSRQLLEINHYLERQADVLYDSFVIIDEDGFRLKKEFMREDAAIRKIIIKRVINEAAGKLKDITNIHIDGVDKLCNKQVGKKIELPYDMIAKREYDGIYFFTKGKMKKEKGNIGEVKISPVFDIDSIYDLKNGYIIKAKLINLDEINIKIPEKTYTKWLDYGKIENTLIIRRRISGDYLQINKQGGTKKLKDYFIDRKIPSDERDNILLLADGSHIIWVPGYRISEKYKITNDTTTVLEIELVRKNNG